MKNMPPVDLEDRSKEFVEQVMPVITDLANQVAAQGQPLDAVVFIVTDSHQASQDLLSDLTGLPQRPGQLLPTVCVVPREDFAYKVRPAYEGRDHKSWNAISRPKAGYIIAWVVVCGWPICMEFAAVPRGPVGAA